LRNAGPRHVRFGRLVRDRQQASSDFRARGLGFRFADGAARHVAIDLRQLVAIDFLVELGARLRVRLGPQQRPQNGADT
jgi:hypothetical protein